MNKKWMSLPALMLAALLGLSACGSNATPSATTATTAAQAAGATTAAAAGETTAATQAAASGPVVLTIGSNADMLTSLDRFANYGFGGDDTGMLWADPLVTTDHKGSYEAGLATEWTHSDDYLSYTFKLREGITFSNGKAFTSADVKKTYERLHEDKTLVDVNAWGNFDTVETPDAMTAIIHLKGVMPTFLDEVARVPIICAEAVTADPAGYFQAPSGTGAFTVTSFDKTTGEVKFARNDAWWGWTDANKTNVDELIYKPILEDTTRASALQSGDVDIATQLTMDYQKTLDASKFAIQPVTLDTHMHVEFSCGEGKAFSSKDLREALSLSIDRQKIVDNILGGGQVATFPIPEGNLGFVAGNSYAYDVEKAKQLVASSGYKGEELDMILTTSSFVRAAEVAQAIQAMASQAGINLKIETLEQATFSDRRNAGDFDLTLGSFAATCGDPQVEASIIIAFDIFGSKYVNEELHNLCVSIQTMADKDQRKAVLEKIFTIEMNEFAPFAYLYSPTTLYATGSGVTNLTVYADGSANYKFVKK